MSEMEGLWTALPDLSFSQLVGLIGAVDDGDLPARLAELRAQFPARVSDCPNGCVVSTPSFDVTISPDTVIVRGVGKQPGRPAVWAYDQVVAGAVGFPLRIVDLDGNSRAFGVITAIAPLIDAPVPTSLSRKEIGDQVFVVDLDDDTRVLIARRVWGFRQGRRELDEESFAWVDYSGLAVGEALSFFRPNGVASVELGNVRAVYRAR